MSYSTPHFTHTASGIQIASVTAHKQKGFNLVEAAIVLGVVGLVIGGVWVAAATVERNRQISEFISGIGFIMSAVDNLPNHTTGLSLITTASAMGIVPSNWQTTGSFQIQTPLRNVVISSSSGINKFASAGLGGEIRVTGFEPNSSLCIETFRKLYGSLRSRISQIIGDIGFDDTPVPLNDMGSFTCPNVNYSIQWR